MKYLFTTLLISLCMCTGINAQEPDLASKVTISGTILEKGTRLTLKNTRVYIQDVNTNRLAASPKTDATGYFSVDIDPGSYNLIVAASGHEKLETRIQADSNQNHPLELWVMPITINPYHVVIKQKKETPEVSTQHISIEEVASLPGTNRDVIRSITNLPGVSSVSVFNGYGNGLVIRGSSQEDSLFTVDDQFLPAFYHFGGFESIIEPEMIESIDYNAGGFSAEYGNAMGGVISLNIRDPRTDRVGGYVNLGMLSSSVMVEGPISEKDSFYIGVKRGFLDQYLKLAEKIDDNVNNKIDFVKYPVYYDTSFIYRHQIAKGNDLRLIGIGADDSVKINLPDEPVSERYATFQQNHDQFASLIGEWRYSAGSIKSTLSPKIQISKAAIEQGERAYHRQTIKEFSLSEKAEYRVNDMHRFKAGIRLASIRANLDSFSMIVPKEGEISYEDKSLELRLNKDISLFYPSIYFMDQASIGKWTLTPGVHLFADTHNDHRAIDPRFSVKYQLTTQTALKTAAGLYSQMPQYDECFEPWGTPGLKPERAIHTVAGIEHAFTDDLTIDVQAYNKQFSDLVVRDIETDPTHFSNNGKGRSYGVEVILRKVMTDKFFGWISYTYSVAKRTDGPDKPERYFDSDMTHNLITVMSYKPNLYWSFGFKYQYASGTPYTDLLNVDTNYDVDNDEYIPQYSGQINDKRLAAHHQFDFRIDKYWIFNRYILSTYLDFRNVFQNSYVTDISYNEDYSAAEEETSIDSQIPMIFLGMKIDF